MSTMEQISGAVLAFGAVAGFATGWGGRRLGVKEPVEEDPKNNVLNPFSFGMSTTSRFVGKMHTRQKTKLSSAANLEEITRVWMTGIPTSIRFLGKSYRVVPSGPGGIILHDASPPPGGVEVDFSHTVNMLTLLTKADIKLKTHAPKDHGQDSRANSPGPTGATGTTHGLAAPTTMKGRSRSGSRKGSIVSSLEESSVDGHLKLGAKLETGEVTKKLLETLMVVRHSTIARWNEHKDVKEDKERQPFFFKVIDKSEKLDQESIDFEAVAKVGPVVDVKAD